jgi:hypothetical protein
MAENEKLPSRKLPPILLGGYPIALTVAYLILADEDVGRTVRGMAFFTLSYVVGGIVIWGIHRWWTGAGD